MCSYVFASKQEKVYTKPVFLFWIQMLMLCPQLDKNGSKFDRMSIIPNIFIWNVRIPAAKFHHKI